MLSSTRLKEIVAEARPYIERQMDDAETIAGFRDVVAAEGGDWSALKALIKAQIKDERDDSGEGKNVRKILDKAEFSSGYADMLGWSNMNEQNFSSGEVHDEPATPAAPADAAVTAGNDLREPVAAEQGQIIREGDAPRETDRDYSGDASRPDAVQGGSEPTEAHNLGQAGSTPAPATIIQFNPEETPRERALRLRPHCLKPDACAGVGREHCWTCRKSMAAQEGGAA